MMRIRTAKRDECGAAAILFTIFVAFGVFFGLAAMAVDVGQMYEVRREAQRAADLAALAGGAQLQMDASDPQSACEAALAYLRSNDPLNRADFPTIPAADTNPCSSSGSTVDVFDTNDDGIVDSPLVEVVDASVKVIAPNQQVPFLFGIAVGQTSAAVNAEATVALRDIGDGIAPFAIPAGCITSGSWHFKIKSGPTGPDTSSSATCDDPAHGNFGWLEIRRDGGNDNGDVDGDARSGADHAIGFVPGVDPDHLAEAPVEAPPCDGTIPTDVPIYYTPKLDATKDYVDPEMPNCISIKKGNMASITAALVGKNNKCDQPTEMGRLNDLSGPFGDKERAFSPCPLNGYRLADYLIAQDGDLTPVKAGNPSVLRWDIVENPNFFVVPVLFGQGRPKEMDTPIVGFRGLFLDCPETVTVCPHPFKPGTTGTPITEINGFVFDLKTIQPSPNSGGSVKDYYTGRGLSVPVMVN